MEITVIRSEQEEKLLRNKIRWQRDLHLELLEIESSINISDEEEAFEQD